MVNMNDSGLWAQGFKCYKQLRALDVINNSRLWITWTTLGGELRAIDSIHSSRLWLTWTTLVRDFQPLEAMNNSILWIILATLDRELSLWMLWTRQLCGWYEWLGILWAQVSRCYKQLRVVDDMNDSWSWAYALNAMNNLSIWITWTTFDRDLSTLDAMNSSRMWMKWATLGH